MDIPQKEQEARSHIELIRRAKGLDGPETNISDLENALIILSEQLYQKSTHFLSELIQNADDNSYDTCAPTLNITFTHSNKTLRIDCNEVGFGKANVEAICKIGRSTKTSLENTTRYIGEKGIGFKSVFKVADVVSISSGHYTFKFEKNKTLGMIAPIWAEFPEYRLPHNTSVLLQLSVDYDTAELEDELKSLDPRLLMFLRKLKQVNVTCYGELGKVWRSSLGRHDTAPSLEGASRVNLHHNAAFSSFEVIRSPVDDMPRDPKRLGCTASEILLAFPVSPNGEPWIAAQKVYAFLPVRDHGFKFLMQADFLLIASREDIDVSSAWNRRLLVAIPEAILQAVHILIKGNLRYSWMRYLPDRPPLSDFFEHLESEIRRTLSQAAIMESLAGQLVAPKNLKFVPAEFCDEQHLPLVLDECTAPKYMCRKYAVDDKAAFIRLGVQELTTREFVDDIQSFISTASNKCKAMPDPWHSALAEALIHAIHRDPRIQEKVSQLPIIPLKNGQWTAPSRQQTCFGSAAEQLSIPGGISVSEIDPQASAQSSRRSLFILLGAKTYSRDLVCDAIISAQSLSDFNPNALDANDLISQAVFLFEAGWKNPGDHDLWVATDDGSAKRSSETYGDSLRPHSAKVLFNDIGARFAFLHPGYSKAAMKIDGSWERWICEQLHVAEYPRLISSLSPKLIVTRDFRILTEEMDPMQLLLLLRDRWNEYSQDFLPSESPQPEVEGSKSKLREKITALIVPCQGGGTRPLGQTVLPLTDILSEDMDSTTFLQVPVPEDARWRFLRHFGVIVDPGVSQYIQYLRQMKDSGTNVKHVEEIYKRIQSYASGDAEEIKKTFDSEDLIYVPSGRGGDQGNWVRCSICVWHGPRWLRKTPCLKDMYSDLYPFFWFTLKIRNATWRTIIDEAEFLNASDDVGYISEVFKAINECLEENQDPCTKADIVKSLKDAHIFPIDAGKSGCVFDYMSTAQDLDMWFIADRWHLKKSFDGLVPLLALSVDIVEKLQLTITTLGLRDRLLSQAAGANAQAIGTTHPHQAFTSSLREKARHIARILPKDHLARTEIIAQLRNLIVYTSEEVVIQWTVKMKSGEVPGRVDSGRVKITQKGNTMSIYLRQKDADGGHTPLDLREHLTRVCELEDAGQIRLLDFILSERDLEEVDNELSRRGYPQSVPEFDDPSLNAGGLSEIWKLSPSEQAVDGRPQFRGRKSNTRRHQMWQAAPDPPDTVQSFLDRFNLAKSFKGRLAQPWSEAEADQMLAHLCRLENIDPWVLLPQKRSTWYNILKDRDQPPGPVTGIHWSTGRDVHYKGHLLRTRNSFPATIYQDSRRNIRISVSTAVQNGIGDEMLFAAELYVSRLLEKQLGSDFIPEVHWTSSLRSKAGLLPFLKGKMTTSTFTINDLHGTFSKILANNGYKVASSWRPSPTFHIDVVPSEGDLTEAFCLDPNQVRKAWECHIAMKGSPPSDVYVLARIIHVRFKPEIRLFVDPWELHAEGLLTLESISQYQGSFQQEAKSVCLQGPEDLRLVGKEQERSLGRLLHRRKHSRDTPSPQPLDLLYRYERLQFDEMRVLELFPGEDDAPLSGSVYQMNLAKVRPYFALSYVWGPAMKSYQLKTTQGNIPLTASLAAALKRIRKGNESIYVWVDAICINQNDDHEKAIQIRMLPRIFHSAEVVLGWIGDQSEDSSKAIQTLLQICTLEICPKDWPDNLPQTPGNWRNGVPPSDDGIWWAIRDLFKREWFSRVWVIQEVVLAWDMRLICGEYEVDWEDIVTALGICMDNNAELLGPDSYLRQILPSLKPAYTLGSTRRAFEDKRLSKRFDLLSLLDIFQYAKSSKECDKLFAMLGIACDSSDSIFDPDYSSPLENVVCRYAQEFVRRGNALELLYRAGEAKSYNFSSWIPNWTSVEFCRTISTWRGTEGVFAAATRTQGHTSIRTRGSNLLEILATQVDTVARISTVSMQEKEIITVVNDAHALIDELGTYPTGESLATVKLKAPIGSAVAPCTDDVASIENITSLTDDLEGDDNPALNNAFDWSESLTSVHCIRDIVNLLEQPKHKRDKSWKYWTTAAAFMKRLSDGRFFVTKRGYIGIGPPTAKVGDRVFVLKGGAVPFLLREKYRRHREGRSNRRLASLVGEAYVHGIMYGEGLQFEGVRTEIIDLE
ncbi:hypothetical protein K458DRAFT_408347 [Lentithecium fluviatile CBS 122367]|uniref:Uncharacterized protein n=1 Tax=Lentithecium fluviatile CBS 122367 TaxID=1168545 RepID=A0A6G1IMA8_9PLEO|nr:hypothetical protein K458DRAFT_408347 [Lentithecium fluviatile CBS 122367]